MECISWKAYEKGILQGFADLKIDKWGIVVKGCKLFMKDGKRWVSPPSNEFTNENGKKKYSPAFKFITQELAKSFSEKAVKAIESYCKEPKVEEPLEEELPF